MPSAVQEAPRVRTPLEIYIARCGGSDILELKSDNAAIAAASALRRDNPCLKIEARYNRVFIRAPSGGQ